MKLTKKQLSNVYEVWMCKILKTVRDDSNKRSMCFSKDTYNCDLDFHLRLNGSKILQRFMHYKRLINHSQYRFAGEGLSFKVLYKLGSFQLWDIKQKDREGLFAKEIEELINRKMLYIVTPEDCEKWKYYDYDEKKGFGDLSSAFVSTTFATYTYRLGFFQREVDLTRNFLVIADFQYTDPLLDAKQIEIIKGDKNDTTTCCKK